MGIYIFFGEMEKKHGIKNLLSFNKKYYTSKKSCQTILLQSFAQILFFYTQPKK